MTERKFSFNDLDFDDFIRWIPTPVLLIGLGWMVVITALVVMILLELD